jgi:hypothetical protein
MSPEELLSHLLANDVTLTLKGSRVLVDGPEEVLTEELVDELRRHKEVLRQMLLPAPVTRAAVRHVDHALGRQELPNGARVRQALLKPEVRPGWSDCHDYLRRLVPRGTTTKKAKKGTTDEHAHPGPSTHTQGGDPAAAGAAVGREP